MFHFKKLFLFAIVLPGELSSGDVLPLADSGVPAITFQPVPTAQTALPPIGLPSTGVDTFPIGSPVLTKDPLPAALPTVAIDPTVNTFIGKGNETLVVLFSKIAARPDEKAAVTAITHCDRCNDGKDGSLPTASPPLKGNVVKMAFVNPGSAILPTVPKAPSTVTFSQKGNCLGPDGKEMEEPCPKPPYECPGGTTYCKDGVYVHAGFSPKVFKIEVSK